MPRLKDYPKWFSIYSEPYPPTKPVEFYEAQTIIKEIQVSDCESIPDEVLIDPSKWFVSLDIEYGYYDDRTPTCKFVQYEMKKIPNKEYKKQLKAFEENSKEYTEKLKEWKELSTKWKAEEQKEIEIAERKQLEKLKNKYDKK